MTISAIKITSLSNIGSNIAYTTLIPVVDMAGIPTTKKANIQIIGNLILGSAGGSYFVPAAQAVLAQSVVNAAQPNITSVGTLTSLTVSGNVTASNAGLGNLVVANFFQGDGGLLSNISVSYSNSNVAAYLPTYTGNVGANWIKADYVQGNATPLFAIPGSNVSGTVPYAAVANSVAVANVSGIGNISTINLDGDSGNLLRGDGTWGPQTDFTYGNGNVANYLPTFTGTIGANRIASNALSGSNIEISANGALFTFGQGGALYWPAANSATWAIEPNIDDEFEIKSTSNVVISTDISNVNSHFTFDSDGIFTAPSNVNLLGSRLNVGPDALNVTTLLNPTLIIANSGAQYIQAAIINTDGTGSSDWAADGAGSSDSEAWADLGFTGYSFNDANYTITGPGDGYVFVQGYANGIGGHLVLATGDLGAENDIIFATGGFSASDEFARIDHANDLFHLTRTGSGIKFQDGTTQNTAAIVWTTAPVSNTSLGAAGEAAYDAGGNLFICVATNTWSKISGTTSW